MVNLDLLPYDEYVARLPGKCMSAGVLLRDESSRVLLVETSYKPQWEIPGGVVEEGEPPWVTAARELYEEVGLDRRPGRLLVVDHVPVENDSLPERMAFVFDGGLIQQDELAGLRFGPEIVSAGLHGMAEARTRVTPLLLDRLTAAVAASAAGATTLCERGKRVS